MCSAASAGRAHKPRCHVSRLHNACTANRCQVGGRSEASAPELPLGTRTTPNTAPCGPKESLSEQLQTPGARDPRLTQGIFH